MVELSSGLNESINLQNSMKKTLYSAHLSAKSNTSSCAPRTFVIYAFHLMAKTILLDEDGIRTTLYCENEANAHRIQCSLSSLFFYERCGGCDKHHIDELH